MNFWWEPRSWAKSGFWTSQAMATWWEKNAGHSMLQCKLETWELCYADCRLQEHRSQYAAIFTEFATVTQHSDRGWNSTCILISSPSLPCDPAYERLYHTTGVYAPILFKISSVGSFKSHKNQNSESASRQGLQFFVLIWEDLNV